MKLYGSSEDVKRRRKQEEEERKERERESKAKRDDFIKKISAQPNEEGIKFVLKRGNEVLGYNTTPGFSSQSEGFDVGELPLNYYGNMGVLEREER